MRSEVGFIRRKLPTADIYFVANTSNRPVDDQSHLRHRLPTFGEQWNPDTAAKSPAPPHLISTCTSPLTNPGSSSSAASSPRPRHLPLTATIQLADLSDNWQVRFAATGKTKIRSPR